MATLAYYPGRVHTPAADRARAALLRALAARHRHDVREDRLSCLTSRQREVVRFAALGLGNAEIARELVVARRTVETHLTSAYRTLGITRRTQLAWLFFSDRRLLEPNPSANGNPAGLIDIGPESRIAE